MSPSAGTPAAWLSGGTSGSWISGRSLNLASGRNFPELISGRLEEVRSVPKSMLPVKSPCTVSALPL